VEIPTLAGPVEIELPEGTQTGKQFRLRGKGIKGLRSSYPGDLYAHVLVETPVRLTERQKELMRELDASLKDPKHSPQTKNWMDRVKEFFQSSRRRALREAHLPRRGRHRHRLTLTAGERRDAAAR